MPYKVQLTYFKESGKYYSDGEYVSEQEDLGKIWEEVAEMFKRGKRPGLVDGKQGFNTLVNLPDHPHAYPRIIMAKDIW